jgi:hypothetical protein
MAGARRRIAELQFHFLFSIYIFRYFQRHQDIGSFISAFAPIFFAAVIAERSGARLFCMHTWTWLRRLHVKPAICI